MHGFSRIVVLVCLVTLLAGCGQALEGVKMAQANLPRVAAPSVSEAQGSQLRDGNNIFAFDLYHAINQQGSANLIYSPYSIWLAFSMVYGGSKGETESQLEAVFHFLGQGDQHATLNAVDQRLQAYSTSQETETEEGTPFQLGLANAVWSQQGYAFEQPYLDLLATQYGAGLHVLDFEHSAEAAREAINGWVEEKTGGRIKEIATPGSILPGTRLVLTNAILFKAGWAYKFDPQATRNGSFTLLDGTEVTTPLMHLRAPLYHLEGEDYQAVRLPYVYQQVEMWIILPAEGRFEAVQAKLGSDLMDEIEQSVEMDEVALTLPRFDFESQISLRALLEQMGLTQAFCPAGDYSGIAEGGDLCIDNAVHKATITVDEEGTEATAATLVIMPVSIMEEIDMTVDRPFIYTITERESGLILFLGQVLDPTVR